MVRKPSNLTVLGITPARIGMTVSRLIAVSLPVVVVTEGRPPAGLSVQKIGVTPATVRVLIPGRLRESGIRIKTEPIDLKKAASSSSLQARLIPPPEVQFAGGKTPTATVSIRLKKSARTAGRP
jgi:YbbR domain-containing protein